MRGRAVQIHPITPVLKAPGYMLLKPIYDEPLSTFAFKFNLRRYSVDNYEARMSINQACLEMGQTWMESGRASQTSLATSSDPV